MTVYFMSTAYGRPQSGSGSCEVRGGG